MLSYAPILWIFLHFCSFCRDGMPLFWIFAPFSLFYYQLSYSTSCTCVLPYYTVIYRDVIFTCLCRLLFYAIYHDKHTIIIPRWHIMAWYDGMIDCNSIKNREGGKRNNSTSYDWKVPHQSHFPPPFCFASLLLIFILFYSYSEGYRTVI